MNVALSRCANDALGISKEIRFTIVHTISAVKANMVASEISITMLILSSVRLLATSLFNLSYFFLFSSPSLHRKRIGIIQTALWINL